MGLTTVRAILPNVKYTGRQVWNRQPGHHTPAHIPGPFRAQRWASTDQWVISKQLAHPALVSGADFIAAQEISALPRPAMAPGGATSWSVCCGVGCVGGDWSRTGRMTGPRTAANMASPVPKRGAQTGGRTSTSAEAG